MTCDRCNDEGSAEGRFCVCPIGERMAEEAYREHVWMKPYARQYNELKRLGDDDEAEALKRTVLL